MALGFPTLLKAQPAPLGIQDEGGTVYRPVNILNCEGSGVSCSHSIATGTLTISGGGGSGSYVGGDGITISGTTINFDGGATPQGELGGTWASPTIDTTHSGSAHHSAVTLSGTGTYLTLVGQDIQVDPITESDISDLGTYLENIVEDTTPQLGGELDGQGNNIVDLADITFRTGAQGGTLRTGTSAADKFTLQAYDVDGGAYVTLMEADAGNSPIMQLFTDLFHFEDSADPTKILDIDVSTATTSTTTTLDVNSTVSRTISLPDATDTLVGRATTDTLTNKTINASNNTISNIGSTEITDDSVGLADINHSYTLAGNPSLATSQCHAGANGIVCEGTTADTFEGLISFPVTTSDKTFTIPNETGTAYTTASASKTSAQLATTLSNETGSGSAVFATSPTLVTPALGTIASGVGTALTALNGENIQDDTIDDDSLDFVDITLADFTDDVGYEEETHASEHELSGNDQIHSISDDDDDTYIQFDASADNDTIHIYGAGTKIGELGGVGEIFDFGVTDSTSQRLLLNKTAIGGSAMLRLEDGSIDVSSSIGQSEMGFYNRYTVTNTADTTNSFRSFVNEVTISDDLGGAHNTGSIQGIGGFVSHAGSGDSDLYGMLYTSQMIGTATNDNAVGIDMTTSVGASSQTTNLIAAEFDTSCSGTCTNVYAYKSGGVSGGTITNYYGMFLDNTVTGTITNNYGIYQNDPTATNIFKGIIDAQGGFTQSQTQGGGSNEAWFTNVVPELNGAFTQPENYGIRIADITESGGSTATSYASLKIEEPISATNNTSILLGDTPPSGNYALYSTSTRDSYIEGAIDLNDSLFIDGDANEVQLTIQGAAGQTNNLFLIEDSAGNDFITIDEDGHIGLDGTAPTATTLISVDSSGGLRGALNFTYDYTSGGLAANILSNQSFSTDIGTGYGVASWVKLNDNSAGTNNKYAYHASVGLDATLVLTTGTQNFYGYFVNSAQGKANASSSGGTVNQYGVYVNDLGSYNGSITTNNIGVYTEEKVVIDEQTGISTLEVGGTTPSCFMVRDSDNAGWTEVGFLNGAIGYITIDADGICDGA